MWEAEFFNRGGRKVLTIGTPLAGSHPETVVNIDADGVVLTRDGQRVSSVYALADAFNAVLGEVVAAASDHRMLLVKVQHPMRVPQSVTCIFVHARS